MSWRRALARWLSCYGNPRVSLGVAEPARPSRGVGPGGRACCCPSSQPASPRLHVDTSPRCGDVRLPGISVRLSARDTPLARTVSSHPGIKPSSLAVKPGWTDTPEQQMRRNLSPALLVHFYRMLARKRAQCFRQE